MGFCENGDELSGSVTSTEFFEEMRNW